MHVKWDASTKTFLHDNTPDDLPTESEDWLNTRIQVVGHGNADLQTIRSFSPNVLEMKIIELTNSKDVGQISIVACGNPSEHRPPFFLQNFMDSLGHMKTTVSIRLAFVSVDFVEGRKFTGEFGCEKKFLNSDQRHLLAIKWTNKNPSLKWIGRYDEGQLHIEQTSLEDQPQMASYYYGIIPDDVPDYTLNTDTQTAYFEINDKDGFELVNRIAQMTYNMIHS